MEMRICEKERKVNEILGERNIPYRARIIKKNGVSECEIMPLKEENSVMRLTGANGTGIEEATAESLASRFNVSFKEALDAAAWNIEKETSLRSMKEVLCEMSGLDPECADMFDSPLSVLTREGGYRGGQQH